jgi:hypothetical protein
MSPFYCAWILLCLDEGQTRSYSGPEVLYKGMSSEKHSPLERQEYSPDIQPPPGGRASMLRSPCGFMVRLHDGALPVF